MLTAGDSFVIRRHGDRSPHLWIVVLGPVPEVNKVVIANVSTLRSHSDTTVVLRPGDHPFIQHDSVIFYSDASIRDVQSLESSIASGVCVQREPCSAELLGRIQAGIFASHYTPNSFVEFCARYLQPPAAGP